MQANDGSMVNLTGQQFDKFLQHGNENLAMVGDVFKVRKCYFMIETISEHGLSAKGISHSEYLDKCLRMGKRR